MMRSSNTENGVKRVARGAARVFALMVLASTVAQAQSASGRDADAPSSGGWHRDQCLGGLTYGGPLKLAVSWAGGLRKELASGQDVCAFVSPKIGLGGARLTTGVAKTFGTFGSGLAISGGILRTFGAPSYADRMSTYAGGSLHVFPLLGIGLEVGSYHRLGGIDGQGRKSIIVWSAGIGF
ncbi:MAG: hypothetical protein ACO1Q7_04170 [Gemmatimonas sp.]